jgi:hypothetical protein
MISLLLKQLLRSKGLIIDLFALFAVGLLSIQTGKVFIDHQKEIIAITKKV